jgi:hypothetical protein
MFEGAAEKLLAGIVGSPEQIAMQIVSFLADPSMTGSVVYVEGGGALVCVPPVLSEDQGAR